MTVSRASDSSRCVYKTDSDLAYGLKTKQILLYEKREDSFTLNFQFPFCSYRFRYCFKNFQEESTKKMYFVLIFKLLVTRL